LDLEDEPDEDAVAGAYHRALAHEAAGEVDAAEAAYREMLVLDPLDRGGAAVRLAALGRGECPRKAPETYVETLFDQHADAFEEILVGHLGYGVPALVAERLALLGAGPFARVLDLGCGTGLVAEALRGQAGEIIGLDLSERMIDIAEAKDIYDGLYAGEAEAFLADNDEAAFDLIVAADVLPYLGDLGELAAGAAANLVSGGLLVVSSELLSGDADAPGYAVTPHHRFAHGESYLRAVLAVEYSVLEITDINVRMQDGQPTPGQLVIARKG